MALDSADTRAMSRSAFNPVPNFYRSRASNGIRLMPFYGDRLDSKLERSLDRLVRPWKLRKRMPW